jgi:hypothetical protein
MATLPPLPNQPDELIANGVKDLWDGKSGLPIPKAAAYIAIAEDALEQLSVLAEITPEALKTDNKAVGLSNPACRKNHKNPVPAARAPRGLPGHARRKRIPQINGKQNQIQRNTI